VPGQPLIFVRSKRFLRLVPGSDDQNVNAMGKVFLGGLFKAHILREDWDIGKWEVVSWGLRIYVRKGAVDYIHEEFEYDNTRGLSVRSSYCID
jgi:hypothetical protein